MTEDILRDTWQQRMADRLAEMMRDAALIDEVKNLREEVKESFEKEPFCIRDNSAKYHHASQAPSGTNPEQGRLQTEQSRDTHSQPDPCQSQD